MTKKQKRKLIRIIVSVILTAIAYFVPTIGWIRLVTFAIPYLIIGYDVLLNAIKGIIHGQLLDEKFLMSIATIGAFATGEYAEGAAVMLFYQVGDLFESMAIGKSRKSIAKLMDIRPEFAILLQDGKEEIVEPDEVKINQTIIVKPGQRIPLDGKIIQGSTSVNTSSLTGESLPVDMQEGDNVISGSINLSGVIQVKVSKEYGQSTVSRILELVENASSKKAKAENFITRFARVYTPCVVVAAILLAIVPPLFIGLSWSEWINRALVFLVVSCPCALVISVPLSFFGGIGGASRQGILIKGSNYLELLSKIDTVVMDKTGTITKGSFTVTAIHPKQVSEKELLSIGALAESCSSHPVAKSIIEAHGEIIDSSRIGEIKEIAGKGVLATIDGTRFYVGNSKIMELSECDCHDCHLNGTIIHIASDSTYFGHIVISDTMKPEAAEAISSMKTLGIKKTVMLTGDKEGTASVIAKEAGVDEYHADLLPEDKVSHLENCMSESNGVAFVGDGINDAPVLMRSDVGIAMGALGSDAAIESADIVLMDDKLTKLPLAISISRKTMSIVRQNICFALIVKGLILLLGALGFANMWIAVFGDVGVMIIAILNAMRAMKAKKPKE